MNILTEIDQCLADPYQEGPQWCMEAENLLIRARKVIIDQQNHIDDLLENDYRNWRHNW